MTSVDTIAWGGVKAVIFDVDGTLYTQSKLRYRMLADLLKYYTVRPWRLQELFILRRFRAEREKRHGIACKGLETIQYTWAASDGQSIEKIKQVVDRWMFRHPNQYLRSCVYPGTHAFFEALRRQNIKIGIYSDYPARDKLAAMSLAADIIVSSTDSEVDTLKPGPRGLLYLAESLGLLPAECLFIGDRSELDGQCAAQAGMPCLIVDKQAFENFVFYKDLANQLKASRPH